jgi:hypothetical protein
LLNQEKQLVANKEKEILAVEEKSAVNYLLFNLNSILLKQTFLSSICLSNNGKKNYLLET